MTASLKLHTGELYSRDRLNKDIDAIRGVLRKDEFLAPELDEPRVRYDSDSNSISIELMGKVGPIVKVSVDSPVGKIGSATQTRLLPIKRDGALDEGAIVEGERRLENYYQEQGYFFANVTPVCSATPQISDTENVPIANGTDFLCSMLASEDLSGHNVEIRYKVDLNRRLKLTEIRLRGLVGVEVPEGLTLYPSSAAGASNPEGAPAG